MPSYNNNTFDDIVYRNSTYYGTAEYLKSKVNSNSWEPVKGEDFINSVNESVIWWNRMTTQPTSTDIVTISAVLSPIVGFWGDAMPMYGQNDEHRVYIDSDDEDNFRISLIQDYVWPSGDNNEATLKYRFINSDSASISLEDNFPIKIYLSHYGNSHSNWRYSGVMSLTRQVGNNTKTYTAYKTSNIQAIINKRVFSLNELNLDDKIFNLNVRMQHVTIFHTLSNTTSAVFTAMASVSDVFRL